jgi:hypothetical protein
MEPTVTCPRPSDFNYFSVPQQRCWLKEKVAKRVGVAILKIGSKRLQGVK